jgi:hypothetical protein
VFLLTLTCLRSKDGVRAYEERGSGPPHFDGKNCQMWQRRMFALLRNKGQIHWDVTDNTTYVHPINFFASRLRDMHDANNKTVGYLFRALRQSEFDRVQAEDLACKICEKFKWLTLRTIRLRQGCLQLTRESMRTSLISPVSP